MKSKDKNSVYVVFDTEQMRLWSSGPKIGWTSSGAAKNAWLLCSKRAYDDSGRPLGKIKFDNQSRYVIIEVSGEKIAKMLEEKKDV